MRHHKLSAALLGRYVGQDRLDLRQRVRKHGVVLQPLLRSLEEVRLHGFERRRNARGQIRLRHDFLDAGVAALQDGIARCQVARTQFDHQRHAAPLPIEELGARRLSLAVVDTGAHFLPNAVRSFEHAGPLLVLAVDGDQHHFVRSDAGRQHQPLVVRVAHDEAADQAGADAPTGLPDVIETPFLVLELHVERLSEILAEVVAGAGLERQPILHHGLDRVAA